MSFPQKTGSATALIISLLFSGILSAQALSENSSSPDDATPAGLLPSCWQVASPHQVPCNGLILFDKAITEVEQDRVLQQTGARRKGRFKIMKNLVPIHITDQTALDRAGQLVGTSGVRALIRNVEFTADENHKPSRWSRGVTFRLPGGGLKAPGVGHLPSLPAGFEGGQVIPAGVMRIGAWPGAFGLTGAGVGVAIVDSGLDYDHYDLRLDPPVMGRNCFSAFNYPGESAEDRECQDHYGHGTHVAGIVAARNNSFGVVGVAPDATLYGVKVLNGEGRGDLINFLSGLDWIWGNASRVVPPIKVVNMSLSSMPANYFEEDEDVAYIIRGIMEILASEGLILIASAGNEQDHEVRDFLPAGLPHVISVANSVARTGTNDCSPGLGPVLADTASFRATDGAYDPETRVGVSISAPGEESEDIYNARHEGELELTSGDRTGHTSYILDERLAAWFGMTRIERESSYFCKIGYHGVQSTSLGGGTGRRGGSSSAAPLAAGVAALMVERNGSVGNETVRSRLRAYACRRREVPLDSPPNAAAAVSSTSRSTYSFDGEREGILWAGAATETHCPHESSVFRELHR